MNDKTKLDEVIKRVDETCESPQARAKRVLEALKSHDNITTWDVLCFCVEYLGMMTPVWSWLGNEARTLNRLVYLAHYVHFGGPGDDVTIKDVLG